MCASGGNFGGRAQAWAHWGAGAQCQASPLPRRHWPGSLRPDLPPPRALRNRKVLGMSPCRPSSPPGWSPGCSGWGKHPTASSTGWGVGHEGPGAASSSGCVGSGREAHARGKGRLFLAFRPAQEAPASGVGAERRGGFPREDRLWKEGGPSANYSFPHRFRPPGPLTGPPQGGRESLSWK